MSLSPELAEVLDHVLESRLADLHTAFPATVVSYDRATQTARLRPAIKQRVPTYEDPEVDAHESLPDLPQVPVVWPGGGASFLAGDLEPGESVLVVCGQSDASAWYRTGKAGDTEDAIRHDISHAYCLPGLRARPQAIPGLTGPLLQVSTEGLPLDRLALASKIDNFAAVIAALPDPTTLPTALSFCIAVKQAFSSWLAPGYTSGSIRTKVDE